MSFFSSFSFACVSAASRRGDVGSLVVDDLLQVCVCVCVCVCLCFVCVRVHAHVCVHVCVYPTPHTRHSNLLHLTVLLQGMNEWRNIQDVIRSTFKALHDVIKAQGDAVKSLERQLEVCSNACRNVVLCT